MTANIINIATSIGDLVDRITILKIKHKRIKNENQIKHIGIELNILLAHYNEIKTSLTTITEINKLENDLMVINSVLWDHENQIRQDIEDADVAKTARAIIYANDRRASIKYTINNLLNSHIIEEKCYVKST